MSGMEERKKTAESKFRLDEELEFKAAARRNKLLGLWAAEQMNLSQAETAGYIREVIESDFEEAGDEDVFRKIRRDFDARGIEQSDHQIRRTMDECMEEARRQLAEEG